MVNIIKSKGKIPKLFHFDADRVFEAEEVQTYLESEHIQYGYSEPGEHRHSGAVENINRTIQDGTRKLLAHASAEPRFWCYAMHQVVYVHNTVITARFQNDSRRRYTTPLEIL